VVIAISTEGWFYWNETSFFRYYAGLKTYTKIQDNNGFVTTGKLSEDNFPPYSAPLDEGGTIILASGVIAIVMATVSIVLIFLHLTRRVTASKMYIGLIGLLISVLIIVIGLIFYDKKLNIGYSFLIFLASAFLIFLSLSLFLTTIRSVNPAKSRNLVAWVLLLSGTTLAVVAMATCAWYYQEDTGTSNGTGTYGIGLKRYVSTFTLNGVTTTTSGSLDDIPAGHKPTRFIDGGNNALGTGVVGLAGAVLALILTMMSIGGKDGDSAGKFMYIGLLAELISGLMILVGAVLYAKALFVSYSFILYVGCAFLFLVVIGLLLAGNFDNEDTSKANYSQPSQRLSHHEQLHDSNVYDDSAASYQPPNTH